MTKYVRAMSKEVTCFYRVTHKNGFLSQWYPAEFQDANGLRFSTAEHYMMHRKALLFGDVAMAEAILDCKHPQEAKRLGRAVQNFDDDVWNAERSNIVFEGNLLKFSQHPDLCERLLGTRGEIVEASPGDAIWGAGVSEQDILRGEYRRYRGLNLLGKALVLVRDRLAATSSSSVDVTVGTTKK